MASENEKTPHKTGGMKTTFEDNAVMEATKISTSSKVDNNSSKGCTFFDDAEFVTPKSKSNGFFKKKSLHPRSPNVRCEVSGTDGEVIFSPSVSSTPSSDSSNVQTPPSKRFQQSTQQHQSTRVRNPFETALIDRLHLPMIASPLFFQRSTPCKLSSTQFEWTIDEVSSLKPVHVEAHETQFQDSPNPEIEAKAQLAISSFFNTHQIVPSPVNCPLRLQQIVLNDIDVNTPIGKPGECMTDASAQTELSLPPILPKELEDALRPYLKPHLANSTDSQDDEPYGLMDSSSSIGQSNNSDFKDTSLRRKLFDEPNVIIVDEVHGSVGGEISQASVHCVCLAGELSDSSLKENYSFSPLLASDDLSASPSAEEFSGSNSGVHSASKQKFLSDFPEFQELSPIHPAPKSAYNYKRCKKDFSS